MSGIHFDVRDANGCDFCSTTLENLQLLCGSVQHVGGSNPGIYSLVLSRVTETATHGNCIRGHAAFATISLSVTGWMSLYRAALCEWEGAIGATATRVKLEQQHLFTRVCYIPGTLSRGFKLLPQPRMKKKPSRGNSN